MHISAQRFNASAVFGLNYSQIDGDDLAGYSKLGWTGGMKLGYPIQDNMDIKLEMLFSERGSSDGFGFGNQDGNFTRLNYISMPIYVDFRDWLIEDEGYHKVNAHGGLEYGYLFSVDSSNGAVASDIDSYRRNAISYLLGVGYQFNRRLGLTIRYTRALNSLQESRAISYFIITRAEYNF